jgi:hypothetical protein
MGIFLHAVPIIYHRSEEVENGCCSSTDQLKGLWQAVWSIKIPRVVQHFLWKACNDILPIKERLYRKGTTTDDLCPICGREMEIVSHVIWSCQSARDVWSECCRTIQKCSIVEGDFPSIFTTLSGKLNDEEMHMMARVARQIWMRRNTVVFEGEFLSLVTLVRQALDQLKAFHKVENSCRYANPVCNRPRGASWQRPKVGFVKFNCDAAINKVTRRMGVGIIARDAGGAAIAVMCASRPYITDPATAEAMVAWMLAKLSLRLGYYQIIAEGDSLEIICALQRENECKGSYGNFVEEAKALLNQMDSWFVQHVGREANTAAHKLAQYVAIREDEQIWTSNFPAFIYFIVISDLEGS